MNKTYHLNGTILYLKWRYTWVFFLHLLVNYPWSALLLWETFALYITGPDIWKASRQRLIYSICLCCLLKTDKQQYREICAELVCCRWHNRDNQEDCALFSPEVMLMLLMPVEESAFTLNSTVASICLHIQGTAINTI